MSKLPTLVIVDARLLAYQTYYPNKPIINTVGIISSELSKARIYPDKIVFAWDNKKGSTRRKALYSEYKGHRKKKLTDKELSKLKKFNNNFNILADVLKYLGSVIDIDGMEADDITNILVELFKDKYQIVLLSSDSDWGYNLVNDNVKQLHLTKGLLDSDKYYKEYGVKPSNVLTSQALMGVAKENVKGVFKLGAKKLYPLLEKHSIEECIEIVQDWVDESKYGCRLPEGFNTVKEMYDFNHEVLRAVTVDDLTEGEKEEFKSSWNNKEKISADDFTLKCLDTYDYPYFLNETDKRIYRIF